MKNPCYDPWKVSLKIQVYRYKAPSKYLNIWKFKIHLKNILETHFNVYDGSWNKCFKNSHLLFDDL